MVVFKSIEPKLSLRRQEVEKLMLTVYAAPKKQSAGRSLITGFRSGIQQGTFVGNGVL
jgi:hypothetical protein